MRMDEIGYHHRHDRSFYIDRPNGADDWLLLIVKSPAYFRINGVDIRTPAKSFIIYTPEYPEYYYPDCDEYYDDWIHFGPDDDELSLIESLDIPLNKPVAVSDITDISAIVRNMCYEQYSANINRKFSVDLYFKLLLYKLNEKIIYKTDSVKVNDSVHFEKLLWIRESIYRWPGREWTLDEMAKELSLSRSRFQHLYSDTFGKSVSQDLIQSRIEKASDMLRKSDLTLKDISSICGYNSVSYFIRQFKNETGKTPSEYRGLPENCDCD